MREYKLSVVGLGHRGRFMFKQFCRCLPGVVGVAACDLRPELFYEDSHGAGGDNPAMAKLFPDAVFYDDFDAMLDKARPDIVLVETPARCHAEFCAKALARNIHVYSDIPSVASSAEADMLWDAQKRSQALLMTGATTCGYGFVLKLQELWRQGLLGKPYQLEAEYIHDCRYLWKETPWRLPSAGKPGPISYCTHSLGPLLSILDEDLRSVVCVDTGSHISGEPYAHDAQIALYQTPSNVVVRQTCSFITHGPQGHSYKVYGTKGYFERLNKRGPIPEQVLFKSTDEPWNDQLQAIAVGTKPDGLDAMLPKDLQGSLGHGGADEYLAFTFINALRNGAKQAPIDLRAGLRMTLPGIFAGESARLGGKPVEITYPWDK